MDGSKDKQNYYDTYDDQLSNILSLNVETKEEMEIVNNEHWDLDTVNYQFYQNRGETLNFNDNNDFKLIVKEEQTKDDLELKKTSEISDQIIYDNYNQYEEEDCGIMHDTPQGNIIFDEKSQLPSINSKRRKYLFSPRHFNENDEFTFSMPALQKPNYSDQKNKNKIRSPKHVKLKKQNFNHIHPIKNISRLNLKNKLSNLVKPVNYANLPIKIRIQNGKIVPTISNVINYPTMSISTPTLTNNFLPRLSMMPTSSNSQILYDHVRDLYIPLLPMLSDPYLLFK